VRLGSDGLAVDGQHSNEPPFDHSVEITGRRFHRLFEGGIRSLRILRRLFNLRRLLGLRRLGSGLWFGCVTVLAGPEETRGGNGGHGQPQAAQ
jgi:hypothetical protein